ncbi:MAG: membrane protein insertion efficiency factor YidD [Pseudomonadota bacterium]
MLLHRIATWTVVGLIKLYQWSLSHIFAFLGVRCRHVPSCSQYGLEAFQHHGLWKGFWLTFSRLSRCHPWGSHGFDPVPDQIPPAGWRFWRLGDWSWTERPAPTTASSPEDVKTKG